MDSTDQTGFIAAWEPEEERKRKFDEACQRLEQAQAAAAKRLQEDKEILEATLAEQEREIEKRQCFTEALEAEIKRHVNDGLARLGTGAAIYRPTVILRPEMVEIGDHSRVDAFVKIEGGKGVRLGKHVHISSYSHLNLGGGVLTMEDYSGVSSGVRIATAVSKFSAVMPESAKTTAYSFVHFKRWSIAYVGALILPGVTLHEGACAAAGAVIRHDIPPWEIWGGNPARKIGTRTPEGAWRYEEEHEPQG